MKLKWGVCADIDRIDQIAQMGFDYLETSASKIGKMTDAEWEEKVRMVEAAPIPCDCFNVLFPKTMDLVGTDSGIGQMTSYLGGLFPRLRRIGAKIVVFGSGKVRARPTAMDFASAYGRLVSVTRKIGEIAEPFGITVGIEPLNRTETNMICSVGEGAILAADAGRPNVQLLADAYHMQMEGEAMENIGRVGRLTHVHIASREGRAYPLREEEASRRLFAQLSAIGYEGRVSIEGKTPDMAHDAPAALRVLRHLSAPFQ